MAGTIVVDTIQDSLGNSTAMTDAIRGSAKAWARFSYGSNSWTINKSYNCSSLTYLASGRFTFNFTNNLPDSNYVVAGSGSNQGNGSIILGAFADGSGTTYAPTTSSFNGALMYATSSGQTNAQYGMVVVFD
jgi:hypothetical protein